MNAQPDFLKHNEKAVVGRLLGFQALAPHLPEFEALDCHWVGQKIASCLRGLTEQALEEPDSDEPLGAFLERLATELGAEVDRILAPREGRLSSEVTDSVSGMLQDVLELVSKFCASQRNLLRELFSAVSHTSANFYNAYNDDVPAQLWNQVDPEFHFNLGRTSLDFAPDIYLKAQTSFSKENPLSAQLDLTLAPRWLDIQTIAALPRVLLHEFISHVPQGPYVAPRSHPDADDDFAEGWMDYVAHEIHWAVLHRRGPSQELATYLTPAWRIIYESAAASFFAQRCAVRDYDHEAAARRMGADAAAEMHGMLEDLIAEGPLATTTTADELLYRLSFGLNASTLNDIDRRTFVARVRGAWSDESQIAALKSALCDWAADDITLDDLMARVLDDGDARY
jgi:hypothetical protein